MVRVARARKNIYIQSSRPWECGNPEGISKECGKGGKPASWLSMLSILCHFHGLLFARQCWTNRYATQRNASHPPRDAYHDRLSTSELAIWRKLSGSLTRRAFPGTLPGVGNADHLARHCIHAALTLYMPCILITFAHWMCLKIHYSMLSCSAL